MCGVASAFARPLATFCGELNLGMEVSRGITTRLQELVAVLELAMLASALSDFEWDVRHEISSRAFGWYGARAGATCAPHTLVT
jgi:hypothetical protein